MAPGTYGYQGDVIDLPPDQFVSFVSPVCYTLAEEFYYSDMGSYLG